MVSDRNRLVQSGWAGGMVTLALLWVGVAGQPGRTEILPQGDVQQPAKTVKEWVAQMEAALVQVTGVTLNCTDAGLGHWSSKE